MNADEALRLLYDECDHYTDAVIAVREEIERMRAQRLAVLAKHTRGVIRGFDTCIECSEHTFNIWPCDTAEALGET